MNAVETTLLSKIYSSNYGKRKVNALHELSLNVERGKIFGLLGPNGAGKTTLIKILLGITFQTSGSAIILGSDPSSYHFKNRVGYLPENHKYPSYLTGYQVLKYFGRLSGKGGVELEKKIDELLELVKLLQWKKTKIKSYSKGMMQRLGLAQALVNDPDLIFLDEPTDGVDPIGRKEIRDLLGKLKNREKTIFLNSHLLSEVELITDRVGILNRGQLLREGTVKELTERKEEYEIMLDNFSDGNFQSGISGLQIKKQKEGLISVRVSSLIELNIFIDELRRRQILIKEIKPLRTSLEDMFISVIKESEEGISK